MIQLIRKFFIPDICVLCQDKSVISDGLCADCNEKIPRISGQRCPQCGGKLGGILKVCSECLRCGPKLWKNAVTAFPYKDDVRTLIHDFKYHKQTYLAEFFAVEISKAFKECSVEDVDVLVPVPLHWTKLFFRGYNQSELLCIALSEHLSIPVKNFLRRTKVTRQQARLDFSQRQINMHNVFKINKKVNIENKKIMLVDDVLTTGATLESATRVLLEAGAESVIVASIARG